MCFRITNLCTCKKRFTEDYLVCVWLFVFAFSFTGKILFCKVIYISSSLPQVLHAWLYYLPVVQLGCYFYIPFLVHAYSLITFNYFL